MIGRLARYIIFAKDMQASVEFYEKVLGLPVVHEEEGFVELDAGGIRLAIHSARKVVPGRSKLAFHVRSVAQARRKLEARGAKMGKILEGKGVQICDGKDPDGNLFQITNRK